MKSLIKMSQAVAAASLLFISATAVAVPITTLYSTGVDDSGAPLSLGANELHYEIVEGSPSFFTPVVTSHSSYMPRFKNCSRQHNDRRFNQRCIDRLFNCFRIPSI